MHDFPVILFPHSHLPDRELKGLLSFFGPLTIFQPWSMERPVLSTVTAADPPCRIVRPLESLQPDGRLKALLAEYRNWVSEHHDRSRMDFIKAVQGRGSSEVSTWQIRRMLREGVETLPSPADDVLRRHLLLHLAQDHEDQRREANRLLTAAQDQASPLGDALGEEITNRDALLGDLSAFDSEPAILDDQLEARFTAWIGLFGSQLTGDEFLITTDPQVAAFVSSTRADQGSLEVPADQAAVRFRVPDFSSSEFEGLVERKAALFKSSRAGKLRALLLAHGQNPSGDLAPLAGLAQEVEASLPWDTDGGALRISVTFPEPAGTESPLDPLSGFLARRSLILVQSATLE